MAENRALESIFMFALAVALGALAVLHWANYVMEAPSWRTSWPAIPLTIAAVICLIAALRMRRTRDRVRLMR